MQTTAQVCLLILVLPMLASSAKKEKKERKSPPQWKVFSMPAMNKRFESVYEGNDLNLDCQAQAHPKPNVRWFKDGVELKNNAHIELKKFNLSLKTLTSDRSGNYTCVVNNKHGQIEWTFHVDVQVKLWPLHIEGPNNITQMAGSDVAFRCRVLNDPKATIRWQKIPSIRNLDDGSPQPDFLPDGEDPTVLRLNNIQKNDEGEYRCMGGNIWGLKHSSAWLTVIEPVLVPELPRQPETDKIKNRNSINSNNAEQPELEGAADNEINNVDRNDAIFDGNFNPEGLDPSDYGPDLYFTTTKRPKNRNNKNKKNERKKDRKGKDKIVLEEEEPVGTSVIPVKVQSTTDREILFKTTFPEIWKFDETDNHLDDVTDTRYNPVKNQEDDSAELEKDHEEMSDNDFEQRFSSWTIYTIVGAIGGVILLIGLVAITLTLCCKKEENNVYKSTPV